MAPETANGRVTMAVLAEKLDNIRDQLDKLDDIEKRLREIEIAQGREIDELERHNRRIDTLETKSDRWDTLNTVITSIVALVGTIAAYFGFTR